MSDSTDNEKQPAASCDGGSPSSSPSSSDYLDLTLSDTEEDGASSPSHTTKTGYKDFGKYAKSLRKRNNPIEKEDDEDIPNLVSPPRKLKKKKGTTKISTSSDIVDCDNIPAGDVGFKFHNTFYVRGKGKIKTTAIFHGEVIYIRDLSGASK